MLIAFEGGEGTGKSTQARLLADRLGAELTHEPGDTPLGAALRGLLLDGDSIGARTEALLMAADRAEHVARVIRPALDRGTHVVTDRYVYSSLAYQGYGRGLDLDAVRSLSTFGGAPQADLVVLLTVPVEIRRARIERGRDRIESDDDAFHERVEKGFLELASADPDRWIVIPATGTIDEVAEQVWTAVSPRL